MDKRTSRILQNDDFEYLCAFIGDRIVLLSKRKGRTMKVLLSKTYIKELKWMIKTHMSFASSY